MSEAAKSIYDGYSMMLTEGTPEQDKIMDQYLRTHHPEPIAIFIFADTTTQ
jgi:hypothetical protein